MTTSYLKQNFGTLGIVGNVVIDMIWLIGQCALWRVLCFENMVHNLWLFTSLLKNVADSLIYNIFFKYYIVNHW